MGDTMLGVLDQTCLTLGYSPRDIQKQAIKWVESVWDIGPHNIVMSLAVASGKSILALTMANYAALKGEKVAIVTPQNILIDQYINDFRTLNYFKGKVHYPCPNMGNCEDGKELTKITKVACVDCPFDKAKERVYEDDITLFNPVSFYLLNKYSRTVNNFHKNKEPQEYICDTLIIDEVQSLPSMLRELCSLKLWWHDIKWKKGVSSSLPGVVELLKRYNKTLSKYIINPQLTKKEKVKLRRMQSRVDNIVNLLTESAEYFICEDVIQPFRDTQARCLMIRPKYIPPKIYSMFFKDVKRVVLMSGTVFNFHWKELGIDRVHYLDLPSPIPVERRRVYIGDKVSVSYQIKDNFDRLKLIEKLAEEIRYIVDKLHPHENGVILVSYSLAKELKVALKEKHYLFMGDKQFKSDKLEQFKKSRKRVVGVFSGSYEGISLNHHISRFTIIPKVMFANLGDKVVHTRMTEDPLVYALETITTLIQATGRSTRTENDWSNTYILDSNFNALYAKTRPFLPNYFKESLVWNLPTDEDIENMNKFRKEVSMPVVKEKKVLQIKKKRTTKMDLQPEIIEERGVNE